MTVVRHNQESNFREVVVLVRSYLKRSTQDTYSVHNIYHSPQDASDSLVEGERERENQEW